MKKTIVIVFTLGISSNLNAQKFNAQIFNSVCKELIKLDNYQSIKKNLKGIHIGVSETGKEKIIYTNNFQCGTSFKSLSEKEQLAILRSDSIPILPLQDTTYIYDTLKFFGESYYADMHEHVFILTSDIKRGKHKGNDMFLYKTGIRESFLITSFTFDDFNQIFNCYFDTSTPKIKLKKTLIINSTKKSYE